MLLSGNKISNLLSSLRGSLECLRTSDICAHKEIIAVAWESLKDYPCPPLILGGIELTEHGERSIPILVGDESDAFSLDDTICTLQKLISKYIPSENSPSSNTEFLADNIYSKDFQ